MGRPGCHSLIKSVIRIRTTTDCAGRSTHIAEKCAFRRRIGAAAFNRRNADKPAIWLQAWYPFTRTVRSSPSGPNPIPLSVTASAGNVIGTNERTFVRLWRYNNPLSNGEDRSVAPTNVTIRFSLNLTGSQPRRLRFGPPNLEWNDRPETGFHLSLFFRSPS